MKAARLLIINPHERDAEHMLNIFPKEHFNCEWTPDGSREAIEARILNNNFQYDVVICAHHPDIRDSSWDIIQLKETLRGFLENSPLFIALGKDDNFALSDLHQQGIAYNFDRPYPLELLKELICRSLGIENKRLHDGFLIHQLNLNPDLQKHPTLELSLNHLGRGGFFVNSQLFSQKPQIGEIIEFDIHLSLTPKLQITGKGRITWDTYKTQDGKRGLGIEFVSLSKESESLIAAFTDLFKVNEFIPIKSQVSEDISQN